MKKLILSLSTVAILSMSFGCTNTGSTPTGASPAPTGSGDIFSGGDVTFTKQQFINYLDCVAGALPSTDPESANLKSIINLSKTQITMIPDAQWNASAKTTLASFEAFKKVMTNLNCKI